MTRLACAVDCAKASGSSYAEALGRLGVDAAEAEHRRHDVVAVR